MYIILIKDNHRYRIYTNQIFTTEKETLETNLKVLTGAIQTCNFLLQAEEKGEVKESEEVVEISKDKEKKTTEKK